eukprot:6734857-Pyramimonas_sp.AAC.1
MDSEPQAPSSGVQGAAGKAACAPAMEAVPPRVHAPGATSGTPEAGESPALSKKDAPGSDGGHRPEGERQRKGPLPTCHKAASALAARRDPTPAWRFT